MTRESPQPRGRFHTVWDISTTLGEAADKNTPRSEQIQPKLKISTLYSQFNKYLMAFLTVKKRIYGLDVLWVSPLNDKPDSLLTLIFHVNSHPEGEKHLTQGPVYVLIKVSCKTDTRSQRQRDKLALLTCGRVLEAWANQSAARCVIGPTPSG